MDEIHRAKPTVTQLVDKLLDAGYVANGRNDKRYSYITLTERGRNIKKDFKEISENVIENFFWLFQKKKLVF